MAAGFTPGKEWWLWLEECRNAGNFSFLGISCIDPRTPASYSSHRTIMDATRVVSDACRCNQFSPTTPSALMQHVHKAWDAPIVITAMDTNTATALTDIDLSILKAASDPHSGDWLHAAPIASLGLKLTNEETRIDIVQRLRARACSPTPVFVASWSTPGASVVLFQEERCVPVTLRNAQRRHLEGN